MAVSEAQKQAIARYEHSDKGRLKRKSHNRRYREEHYDRWRESHRRATQKNPISYVFSQTKQRAKRKGLPFSLTVDYLRSVPVPTHCPVLGIELAWGVASGKGRRFDNSISIDRIVPSLGYVQGNVRWISDRANGLLRDGTLEEFKKVVAFLEEGHS